MTKTPAGKRKAAPKSASKLRKSHAQANRQGGPPSEAELPAAVYVDPKKLVPWAGNPRHNDQSVEPVVRSIKQYGFGAPLLARLADGEIIAGHTRLKAALQLKLKQVPVRYLDLTEAQAHELALADNRLGELATWDDAALLAQLQALDAERRAVVGWTDADMAALERNVLGAGGGGDVSEDEPPPLPKTAITKLGDIWQLGRHRLICGDCRQPEVLTRLLEGRKVGLLETDPPYGVQAKTGTRNVMSPAYNKGPDRNVGIENDDLDAGELETFLRAAFHNALGHMAPGASWYIWYAGTMTRPFVAAADELGGFRHSLVWTKSKFVFGRCDYHYRHEPVLYGWVPGGAHTWIGSRDQDSVWEVPLDKAVGELVHPSVKPVELYARPIRNHLGADGAILDLFAGTGPAVSAAEQLGRTAYMVELDPKFCDVIVGRWEALSGGRGVRLDARAPAAAPEPPRATSRPPRGKKARAPEPEPDLEAMAAAVSEALAR